MKKTLLMMAMAMPALAGDPVMAPATPAPAPAPAVCPLSFELGAQYNFAARELSKDVPAKETDTYGLDLTACYALDENNSLNLRFAYTYGSEIGRFANSLHEAVRVRNELHTFSLMPGYRFTQNLGDGWSWFAGVNAGVANLSRKETCDRDGVDMIRLHDSAWGFAASGELGIRKQLCENVDVFVAYQLSGNTARPAMDWGVGDKEGSHRQIYNGVRAGLGFKF